MKLIRKSNNLFPVVPGFFDDFILKDLAEWFDADHFKNGVSMPAANIRESEDKFEVELAIPGMNKNDLKIELDQDVLTISAERKDQKEAEDKRDNYFKKEFSYQSFERKFSLPVNTVDSDHIKASYQNGILQIDLPKRDEVKPKPSRLISIN